MNRQRRCALIAPLLASAVALPPTAALAAPSAVQAPAAPACQLKAIGGSSTNVNMELTGFRPNQKITINRIGGRASDTRVNAQGNLIAKNLRDGTYNVRPRDGGRGSTVPCTEGPAPVNVNIAEADVVATKPDTPTVKCNQATPVTFEGTLTGTGSGDIKVVWTSPDTGKRTEPMVKFTAPSAKTQFVVNAPARANPAEPRPTVKAQLLVPRQGSEQGVSSAVFTVTLHCEAGT
ncbi:hypothetical protein ABZZ17_24930 [Streptomyces sp. NPDC006512]|uniref:hypothetical protein n=1 Tax=Streptomyces sp. NPDC006512 TaxID=3154307 RepID=UPI0033A60571